MILWTAIFVVTLAFAIGAVRGAPYLPTRSHDVSAIFELSGLKPGQKLVDLGSGDGRLLAAAARRGIHALGLEINPFLVALAKLRLWRYKSADVRLADLWLAPLPKADCYFVFLMPKRMERLESKLEEADPGSLLVSYQFELPNREPLKVAGPLRLYRLGA